MTDLARFEEFFTKMGVKIADQFTDDESGEELNYMTVAGGHFVFNAAGQFVFTVDDETGDVVRRKT
jgi:predicted lactoylglutathione lyase